MGKHTQSEGVQDMGTLSPRPCQGPLAPGPLSGSREPCSLAGARGRSPRYRQRRFQDAPLTILTGWVERWPFARMAREGLPEWRREMMWHNRAMLDEGDEVWCITDDRGLAYDLGARRLDPWLLWCEVCDALGRPHRWHVRAGLPIGCMMDLCRVYLAWRTSRLVWLDSDARLLARPRIDMREERPLLYERGPLVALYSGIECEATTRFWEQAVWSLAEAAEGGVWLAAALALGDGVATFPGEYLVHHFRGAGVRRWQKRRRICRT